MSVPTPKGGKEAGARRIVFVCVGNMCRSQMAEGLARYLGGGQLVVESAGTRPTGLVSPEAAACMAEIGIDISEHRSKGLREVELGGADVVVSMAPESARTLAPPGCGGRLEDWDVGDPIGFPLEIYRIIRSDLIHRVTTLLSELGVETRALREGD